MKKEKVIKILHRLSDGRTYRDIAKMPINSNATAIIEAGRILQLEVLK